MSGYLCTDCGNFEKFFIRTVEKIIFLNTIDCDGFNEEWMEKEEEDTLNSDTITIICADCDCEDVENINDITKDFKIFEDLLKDNMEKSKFIELKKRIMAMAI